MLSLIKIFVLIYSVSRADQLESRYMRLIAKEKKPEKLEFLMREYENAKVLHVACEIELKHGFVPASCYEELELMHQGDTKTRERRVYLDRICRRAALRTDFIPRPTPSMSSDCAAQVREALAIREYRGETRPADWSGI